MVIGFARLSPTNSDFTSKKKKSTHKKHCSKGTPCTYKQIRPAYIKATLSTQIHYPSLELGYPFNLHSLSLNLNYVIYRLHNLFEQPSYLNRTILHLLSPNYWVCLHADFLDWGHLFHSEIHGLSLWCKDWQYIVVKQTCIFSSITYDGLKTFQKA